MRHPNPTTSTQRARVLAPLIAIAGLQGSGKTTIVQRYADRALCLHLDRVLIAAARRAFPYLRQDCLQQWGAWPKRMDTMDTASLFDQVLREIEPRVSQPRRAVLMEGVILSQDWFREPLAMALRSLGQPVHEDHCQLLRLEPPAHEVHAQIQARAIQAPGRAAEAERFPDARTVLKRQQAYAAQSGSAGRWRVFDSPQALNQWLDAHLPAPVTVGA